MILVRLKGGLGNQMFQYAAGFALAEKHKTRLLLEISSLQKRGPEVNHAIRDFELPAFKISSRLASSEELKQFEPKLLQIGRPLQYAEKHFQYNTGFESLPSHCSLDGYWQSERYFSSIANKIRQEFVLEAPLTGLNADLAKEMLSTESVALHVRRGDYVESPEVNAFHGVCEAEYFERGMDLMASTLSSPKLFVFSDDPLWAKHSLRVPFPVTYVTHNLRPALDLHLISSCKHQILSNSTFSWWGAWLNRNSEKVVVAPKQWFRYKSIDTSDLLPAEWIRI